MIVLPMIKFLSRTLIKLAIDLDKRLDLIAHLLKRVSTFDNEEIEERVTLVEGIANVIREAFKKCLNEKSGNASEVNNNEKSNERRMRIYLTANLCLKLFFHCRKVRDAKQIFANIYQQSSSLALFLTSQRVTFFTTLIAIILPTIIYIVLNSLFKLRTINVASTI